MPSPACTKSASKEPLRFMTGRSRAPSSPATSRSGRTSRSNRGRRSSRAKPRPAWRLSSRCAHSRALKRTARLTIQDSLIGWLFQLFIHDFVHLVTVRRAVLFNALERAHRDESLQAGLGFAWLDFLPRLDREVRPNL